MDALLREERRERARGYLPSPYRAEERLRFAEELEQISKKLRGLYAEFKRIDYDHGIDCTVEPGLTVEDVLGQMCDMADDCNAVLEREAEDDE